MFFIRQSFSAKVKPRRCLFAAGASAPAESAQSIQIALFARAPLTFPAEQTHIGVQHVKGDAVNQKEDDHDEQGVDNAAVHLVRALQTGNDLILVVEPLGHDLRRGVGDTVKPVQRNTEDGANGSRRGDAWQL